MDIEGTYTLQALPEDVWNCLMDRQALRQAIPGVEHLEALGENKYAITLHIGHAPLVGLYSGHVTITDQQYPYYYSLSIEGEGRQSRMHGEGIVHLSGRGENTIVAYKGSLNIGKLEPLLPLPVVKGTARLLIQQFFTSLADQLRTMKHPETVIPGESNQLSVAGISRAATIVSSSATSPTLLQVLVHRLGLGAGDPAQEAIWVTRLRRISIGVMLVLLFWVGTKLPRRVSPKGLRWALAPTRSATTMDGPAKP